MKDVKVFDLFSLLFVSTEYPQLGAFSLCPTLNNLVLIYISKLKLVCFQQ